MAMRGRWGGGGSKEGKSGGGTGKENEAGDLGRAGLEGEPGLVVKMRSRTGVWGKMSKVGLRVKGLEVMGWATKDAQGRAREMGIGWVGGTQLRLTQV